MQAKGSYRKLLSSFWPRVAEVVRLQARPKSHDFGYGWPKTAFENQANVWVKIRLTPAREILAQLEKTAVNRLPLLQLRIAQKRAPMCKMRDFARQKVSGTVGNGPLESSVRELANGSRHRFEVAEPEAYASGSPGNLEPGHPGAPSNQLTVCQIGTSHPAVAVRVSSAPRANVRKSNSPSCLQCCLWFVARPLLWYAAVDFVCQLWRCSTRAAYFHPVTNITRRMARKRL